MTFHPEHVLSSLKNELQKHHVVHQSVLINELHLCEVASWIDLILAALPDNASCRLHRNLG